ncbi:type II and III secretion system protein family protein [Limnohabitans sp. 2KL-1]|uniref:type II and III secretion system protein family protein n=1 Tax=Limnohabitans sp. 2KL-1 TaxID=1100699 RepID=UPI001E36CA93|nr:type II and III secretion system protein family protein [Limnohabitans sp. 2KL-1]
MPFHLIDTPAPLDQKLAHNLAHPFTHNRAQPLAHQLNHPHARSHTGAVTAQRQARPAPRRPALSTQLALALAACLCTPQMAWAATATPATATSATPAPASSASPASKAAPRTAAKSSSQPDIQTQGPVKMAPPLRLTAGKSMLLQLSENAARLSVGNPDVADVVLINPREIYLLGKKSGQTNLLIWTAQGTTTLRDITVGADTDALHAKLREYVPGAENLRVDTVADSLVLSGRVSDGMKVQRLMALTQAFNGDKKVINLLRVHGTQQVMLEVKVAEVSKTLLDELGVDMNLTRTIGNTSVNLLSQLLSAGSTAVTAARANGLSTITLTAEMKKGLVKVLAEPTITAISGQEGSFLAGGKIFIPVPQTSASGGTTITLEEKEFGVGLRFLPTVLEDGLINLRVTPEVSELSQLGTTVKGLGGQSSLLPSITTRRASTTVQLRDGESFAIGGLVKSNVTETIKAFPLLGELPVLGALFRSTAFQTDKSELLFVVTPRLAKVLPPDYALPTDAYIQPTRSEFFLNGQLEGRARPASPTSPTSPEPAKTDAPDATPEATAPAQQAVPPAAPSQHH